MMTFGDGSCPTVGIMKWLLIGVLLIEIGRGTKYPGEEKHDMGSLEGDVQNWAMLIQNYILQV